MIGPFLCQRHFGYAEISDVSVARSFLSCLVRFLGLKKMAS